MKIGILKKAGEAKDLTDVGQEKESITLAYNSILIDKIQKENNSITVDEFDKAIKSYDTGASVASEREKLVVTFSNGHKYSIYNNGKVTEYTTKPYAVDELIVKVSGDTVTSPYYVNYPSTKGTIKCRVLYNDDTYGLQIISVNPITKVKLGKNDPNTNVTGEMGSLERAQNSYNRAITTLNEKAEEYKETSNGSILATDTRCVGSNPLNKNHPENLTGDAKEAEMKLIVDEYNNNQTDKYYKTDIHYEIDYKRLDKIGIKEITDDLAIEKDYWLASHMSEYNSNYKSDEFNIRYVKSDGTISVRFLYMIYHLNRIGFLDSPEKGFRPIFILSPNVKIIDGEGTEEVPFEIGL